MFQNPKTTITAIVAAVAYIVAVFGIQVGPEVQSAIVTIAIFLIGLFAADGKPAK